MDTAGVNAFADALLRNRSLTALNLGLPVKLICVNRCQRYRRRGGEGDRFCGGADLFAREAVLEYYCYPRYRVIDGNKMGDEGAIALADALAKNRTLVTLSLSNNTIRITHAYRERQYRRQRSQRTRIRPFDKSHHIHA